MSKFMISCLAASTFLFVSCKETKNEEKSSTTTTVVTVDHLSGTTEVKENPKNAVVLSYGMLDTFDELDIPVKGVPGSNLPAYLEKYKAATYENVGGIKDPNAEKVNATDTELIIISARTAVMYDEFKKIAPTINLDVDVKDYMNSFKKNQRIIGQLYGKEEQVEKELKDIDDRIATLKSLNEKSTKKGLIVLANEGRLSSYGIGSRFGIIHDVFGVKPADEKIEAATHGQVISNELIKELNPDYIFVIDRGAAIKRATMSKEEFANVLIQQTNAYKENKIIFLNPETWYLSGGGLKSIKMMIEEIENAVAK